MEFRDGEPLAPLSVAGPAQGKRGTEVTFLPSPKTFTMTEFDFATLEHRLRELAFLNSGVLIVLSDLRHPVEKREELRYEGGVEAFVKYIDRNKTPLIPAPIMIKADARGRRGRMRAVVERRLPRGRAVLHQHHPAARRRHPSRRLPRRADAPGHRLRREERRRAEGEGRADRRRLPRGAHRRPLLQGAGPEILLADQGQARVLRGASGGREHHQRGAAILARGASGGGEGHRRQGGRGRRRPRGRAQGARADAQEGRARYLLAPGQARRLPGARSGQVRIVPRRGRQRGRLRQAGPRPRLPGGAAAARKDPQCRARAHGQDAVQPGDRHAHHRARDRHQRRVQRGQAALSQDHHHDGCRRRRLPYPHAAAHLLLPADARPHRSRPPLHRPAAALQGRRAASRSSISRTSARSRTISSPAASRRRRCGCSRASIAPARI